MAVPMESLSTLPMFRHLKSSVSEPGSQLANTGVGVNMEYEIVYAPQAVPVAGADVSQPMIAPTPEKGAVRVTKVDWGSLISQMAVVASMRKPTSLLAAFVSSYMAQQESVFCHLPVLEAEVTDDDLIR